MKPYKNYFYLIIIFVGLLVSSSCEKSFLDENSPDELTTSNFWRDKEDALSGLAAAYSQLEHFSGWDNYIEARSIREYYRSNYMKPGADAYNYDWWMQIYNFSFTSGNYAVGLLWRDDYRGINFANQVITNVGEMEADQIEADLKREIIAEARFLRGWYYFDLIKNFEEIVLRDEVTSSESDIGKPLSTRSEIWNFIIADLKAAEADLPLRSNRSGSELGRATKGSAQAYLGIVHLYRAAEEDRLGNMAEASGWFQKVVDSGEYALDENFLGMFNGTNDNSKESVFELQQTSNTANGANYRSNLSTWVAASEIGGYGEIYGTDELLTAMTAEGKIATDGRYDHRIYQTMYFNDPYFNNSVELVYGEKYDDVFGAGANTIAFRKWLPRDGSRIQQANAINMPLMRYADVLLMLAEALNEQEKFGDAVHYINEVRRVHGKVPNVNPSGKEAIFKQIRHERVMDLTLEGKHFYDLRRWGVLQEEMNKAGRSFSMDKAFFPIPQDEVHYNPDL